MEKAKIVARVLVVVILALFAVKIMHRDRHIEPTIRQTKLSAVVRLYDVASDRFFCTGFAVSDKLIVTAAHCIADDFVLGMRFAAHPQGIEVRDAFGKHLGVHPTDAKYNVQADQAILIGDFSMFDKLPIVTNPENVVKLAMNRKIANCGFPYSGPLYCTDYIITGMFGFYFEGTGGQTWPGMSGGPVIDLETGYVIGIYTGALGNKLILAPTVNLFYNLGIAEIK